MNDIEKLKLKFWEMVNNYVECSYNPNITNFNRARIWGFAESINTNDLEFNRLVNDMSFIVMNKHNWSFS